MISGAGRNGSTALMALIGSDSSVFFEKQPPYEVRYLTYLAKLAALFDLSYPASTSSDAEIYKLSEPLLSLPPWYTRRKHGALSFSGLSGNEAIENLWSLFSTRIKDIDPAYGFYAEKVLEWVPSIVTPAIGGKIIHLVRDPRDVFISANDYMTKMGYFDFHRAAGDTDWEYSVKLSKTLWDHFLNYKYSVYLDGQSDGSAHSNLAIKYESMIESPESVAKSLGEFLELNLSASVLSTRSGQHATSDTNRDSLYRWKNRKLAKPVRECLETVLQPMMLEFGYEIDSGCSNSDQKITSKRYFAFSSAECEFDQGNDFSFSCMNAVSSDEISTTFIIDSGESWLALQLAAFQAEEIYEVWISVWGGQGSHCSLYWSDCEDDFDIERSITQTYVPAPFWRTLRFEVSNRTSWKGRISHLRFNIFNGVSISSFPARISSIRLIDNIVD